MITLRDLYCNDTEIQGDMRLCYYDYDKEERVIIPESKWDEYLDCDIHFIYVDREAWEPDSVAVIYVEIRKKED